MAEKSPDDLKTNLLNNQGGIQSERFTTDKKDELPDFLLPNYEEE